MNKHYEQDMINVASCLNEYYVPYTYVMLKSLFESNAAHDITVYLLHDGLSEGAVERFDELAAEYSGGSDKASGDGGDKAAGGVSYGEKYIRYIHVTDYDLDPRIHQYGGWNELTMYRLLLWDILPEGVERVLHLDGDMLILRDLMPLYETDFEGNDLIACQDVLAHRFRQQYCIETHGQDFRELFESGTYINAGMILMNVKKNRGRHLLDVYEKRATELSFVLPYPDQDLLNIIHQGSIKYVDTLEYNFPAFDGVLLGGYDADRVKKEVAVLHFLDKKPWNDGEHELYDIEKLWWDVAEDTPYVPALSHPLTAVVIRLSEDEELLRSTVDSVCEKLPAYFREVRIVVADTVGGYTGGAVSVGFGVLKGSAASTDPGAFTIVPEVLDMSATDYSSVTAVKNDILRDLSYDRIIFIEEGDAIGDIEVLNTSDESRLLEVLLTDGVGVYDRVIWPRTVTDSVGHFINTSSDADYELLIRAIYYGFFDGVILWQDAGFEHQIFTDTYMMYAFVLEKYRTLIDGMGLYEEVYRLRADEMAGYGMTREWGIWNKVKNHAHRRDYLFMELGTMPVAIQSGMTECQGALDNFAKKLGEALRRQGCGVIFWDAALGNERMQKLMLLPYAAVVGFQSRLFARKLSNGTLFGNLITGKKFNFLFDHPIYLTEDFREPVRDMHILSQDETYAEYVREKFPHMAGVYHFPPAGITFETPASENAVTGETPASENAVYDLTFIGTYNDYRNEFSAIRSLPPNYRMVARRFLMYSRRHPNERAEEVLFKVIDAMGYERLSDDAFAQALYAMGNVVRCLMYYFREQVVRALLDGGVAVDVFSRTWEKAPYANHPGLHIHDEVDYESSIGIMAKSRLTLNVMSWHKGGMTERIANAMLNHSVVVSDRTTYLVRKYGSSDTMLIYDLEDFSDLPDRVKALLADRDTCSRMADRAYADAIEHHTWDARAKEFLEILNEETGK